MKQINLSSGYTRDVKIVNAPAAELDKTSMKEELRACTKSIRSLKNMVLKLEADLLAVKVRLLENEANRVAANAATANQVADLKTRCTPGCASLNVSRDPVCERCDPGAYWAHDYLSEESEDDY